MDSAAVPLAEMISALRQQLEQAMNEGQGKDLRFLLGPVDLELAVEVSRDAEAQGGIAFWVVSMHGKAGRSTSSTQTMRLSLVPRTAAGDDVLVGSRRRTKPK